ncbi:MAG: hypothetical protein K0R66_1383 [Gammaproteobacteria bacterium]|jgi:hypothetical protein|nr:hypothetical protein [Gammaproteobacteria bacterium]
MKFQGGKMFKPGFIFSLIGSQKRAYLRSMSTLPENAVAKLLMGEIQNLQDISALVLKLHEGKYKLYNAQQEHYKAGYPPVPAPMACWFRGQADRKWDLIPAVHRVDKGAIEEKSYNETALVHGFLLQHPHPSYIVSGQVNINLVLSNMQHYSYPTRFLDWTSNMMYAVYFACENDENDGLVWVLNPFRLNAMSLLGSMKGMAMEHYFDARFRSAQALVDSYDEIIDYLDLLLNSINRPQSGKDFNIKNPKALAQFLMKLGEQKAAGRIEKVLFSVAVDPGNQNARIVAQQGKFTIASGKQYYDRAAATGSLFPEPISLYRQAQLIEERKDGKPCLGAFIIEGRYKKDIKRQIESVLGINHATLMLDMDAQGKVAKEAYVFRRGQQSWAAALEREPKPLI